MAMGAVSLCASLDDLLTIWCGDGVRLHVCACSAFGVDSMMCEQQAHGRAYHTKHTPSQTPTMYGYSKHVPQVKRFNLNAHNVGISVTFVINTKWIDWALDTGGKRMLTAVCHKLGDSFDGDDGILISYVLLCFARVFVLLDSKVGFLS